MIQVDINNCNMFQGQNSLTLNCPTKTPRKCSNFILTVPEEAKNDHSDLFYSCSNSFDFG